MSVFEQQSCANIINNNDFQDASFINDNDNIIPNWTTNNTVLKDTTINPWSSSVFSNKYTVSIYGNDYYGINNGYILQKLNIVYEGGIYKLFTVIVGNRKEKKIAKYKINFYDSKGEIKPNEKNCKYYVYSNYNLKNVTTEYINNNYLTYDECIIITELYIGNDPINTYVPNTDENIIIKIENVNKVLSDSDELIISQVKLDYPSCILSVENIRNSFCNNSLINGRFEDLIGLNNIDNNINNSDGYTIKQINNWIGDAYITNDYIKQNSYGLLNISSSPGFYTNYPELLSGNIVSWINNNSYISQNTNINIIPGTYKLFLSVLKKKQADYNMNLIYKITFLADNQEIDPSNYIVQLYVNNQIKIVTIDLKYDYCIFEEGLVLIRLNLLNDSQYLNKKLSILITNKSNKWNVSNFDTILVNNIFLEIPNCSNKLSSITTSPIPTTAPKILVEPADYLCKMNILKNGTFDNVVISVINTIIYDNNAFINWTIGNDTTTINSNGVGIIKYNDINTQFAIVNTNYYISQTDLGVFKLNNYYKLYINTFILDTTVYLESLPQFSAYILADNEIISQITSETIGLTILSANDISPYIGKNISIKLKTNRHVVNFSNILFIISNNCSDLNLCPIEKIKNGNFNILTINTLNVPYFGANALYNWIIGNNTNSAINPTSAGIIKLTENGPQYASIEPNYYILQNNVGIVDYNNIYTLNFNVTYKNQSDKITFNAFIISNNIIVEQIKSSKDGLYSLTIQDIIPYIGKSISVKIGVSNDSSNAVYFSNVSFIIQTNCNNIITATTTTVNIFDVNTCPIQIYNSNFDYILDAYNYYNMNIPNYSIPVEVWANDYIIGSNTIIGNTVYQKNIKNIKSTITNFPALIESDTVALLNGTDFIRQDYLFNNLKSGKYKFTATILKNLDNKNITISNMFYYKMGIYFWDNNLRQRINITLFNNDIYNIVFKITANLNGTITDITNKINFIPNDTLGNNNYMIDEGIITYELIIKNGSSIINTPFGIYIQGIDVTTPNVPNKDYNKIIVTNVKLESSDGCINPITVTNPPQGPTTIATTTSTTSTTTTITSTSTTPQIIEIPESELVNYSNQIKNGDFSEPGWSNTYIPYFDTFNCSIIINNYYTFVTLGQDRGSIRQIISNEYLIRNFYYYLQLKINSTNTPINCEVYLNDIITQIVTAPGEYTFKGIYMGTSDTDLPVVFIVNKSTTDIQLEYVKLVTPSSIITPIESRRTVTTSTTTTTVPITTTTNNLYFKFLDYTTPVLNWNFISGGTGVPTYFTGTNATRSQINTNTFAVTLKFGSINGYIQQQINENITFGTYYVQIKISSDFIISCRVKLSTSTNVMINEIITNSGEYMFSYNVSSISSLIKPTIYIGNNGGNNFNVEYIRVITPNSVYIEATTTTTMPTSTSTSSTSSTTPTSTSSTSSTTPPTTTSSTSSTTTSTTTPPTTTSTPTSTSTTSSSIALTSSALITTTTIKLLTSDEIYLYYNTPVLNWDFSLGGTTIPPYFSGTGCSVILLASGNYAINLAKGTGNNIKQLINENITSGYYYIQFKISSIINNISGQVTLQIQSPTPAYNIPLINEIFTSPGTYTFNYNLTYWNNTIATSFITIINTGNYDFNIEYIKVITPNSIFVQTTTNITSTSSSTSTSTSTSSNANIKLLTLKDATTTPTLTELLTNYSTPILNWNFASGGINGMPNNFTGSSTQLVNSTSGVFVKLLKLGMGYISQTLNETITSGPYYIITKISPGLTSYKIGFQLLDTLNNPIISQTIIGSGIFSFSGTISSSSNTNLKITIINLKSSGDAIVEYLKVITPNSIYTV